MEAMSTSMKSPLQTVSAGDAPSGAGSVCAMLRSADSNDQITLFGQEGSNSPPARLFINLFMIRMCLTVQRTFSHAITGEVRFDIDK